MSSWVMYCSVAKWFSAGDEPILWLFFLFNNFLHFLGLVGIFTFRAQRPAIHLSATANLRLFHYSQLSIPAMDSVV